MKIFGYTILSTTELNSMRKQIVRSESTVVWLLAETLGQYRVDGDLEKIRSRVSAYLKETL